MRTIHRSAGARHPMAHRKPCPSGSALPRLGLLLTVTAVVASSGWGTSGLGADDVAAVAGRPSLAVLEVADGWLGPWVERPFDKSGSVELEVLGIQVRGTARTTGRYTVGFADGDGGLRLVVVAHGVSVSSTHGRRGPAMIHCETSTRFEARKIVELIGDSVITHPVSVQAETESVRTSVASQWHVGRRVVRAVAERKIRQGRDEIAEASRRRAENRVVAVVDRVVERLRGRAEAYLSRHGSTWTWVSWGDRPAPLKLETDDGFLRLHYQPGPSRMENPLFVRWGQHGRGLRLWVDRRLFRVESDYLQAQMRDGWRVAALAALMLPESDVSASWMAEILDSPPALRVVVPSIELVVSVPAPRDSVTSWLAAAARAWRAGVRLNRETEPQ